MHEFNYFSAACPSGFTYVPSVKGCYSVVLENLEWALAGLRCKALHPDAHLVIITSAAEQEAIKTLLYSYSGMRLIRNADVAPCL